MSTPKVPRAARSALIRDTRSSAYRVWTDATSAVAAEAFETATTPWAPVRSAAITAVARASVVSPATTRRRRPGTAPGASGRSRSVPGWTAVMAVIPHTSIRAPPPSYRRDLSETVAPVGYNRAMPVPLSPSIPSSFGALAARVSNWGRWGPEDQLGTLNLIDRAARLRGVASVRDGEPFPLGLPLSAEEGIQLGFIEGRVNPTRTMLSVNEVMGQDPGWIAFSEDVVTMAMQCATHWDSLAHAAYGAGPDGRSLYNGVPASSITEAGASRLGIHLITSLVSRGVLLDVARSMGSEILDPGYPITPEDLDAACAFGGVRVEPGDVVLVRTGQPAHLALPGRPGLGGSDPVRDLMAYSSPSPGLTMATAEWFHRHDV